MVSLETALTTLKDKVTDNEHLSFCAKGQTWANKIAIKYLTTDLGYMRTDVDLQKDRLDNYSRQLEAERIAWEGQGSKLVELETTQKGCGLRCRHWRRCSNRRKKRIRSKPGSCRFYAREDG